MRILASFAILCLALCAAQPARAAINDFVGTWVNQDENTKGVTKLVIKRVTNGTTMQAFGSCTPSDCDWGAIPAEVYGPDVSSNAYTNANAISAIFKKGFAETIVVLTRQGDRLEGEFLTRFTDGSGRASYVSYATFEKAPAIVTPAPAVVLAAPKQDCIKFSNANAKAGHVNGNWKIVDGDLWILDFGNEELETVEALSRIKSNGFNEQCFVGRPDPSFTYWLKDGQAGAKGAPTPGEDCLSFSNANAEAKKISGSWKIVDGDHWMFDFGDKEDEAKQALAIIKYFGFSHTCYVGRPDPSMVYLLK